MLTTEEEAKTKRCQESFSSCAGVSPSGLTVACALPYQHGYGGGGAYAVTTAPANCIGSACMAWRWAEMIERTVIDGIERPMGFCGKAGKP